MKFPLLRFLFVWMALMIAAVPSADCYQVTAKSAIYSNSSKAKRYYGKNVHKQVAPASTVKVMTAILVLEKFKLNDYIRVSANATYPQPSKIYVRPGEEYKVKDLLYALLLNSANDAAVVLAEAVAGSEAAFVKRMNQRARQLGCKHTNFGTPHGLPSRQRQYSTAYDMYLIFRHALSYEAFRNIIKTRSKIIYSKAGRKIVLKTHNQLLFKNWKHKIYGKTGYTRAAGPCFVGYFEHNGETHILAIFGSAMGGKRWTDIRHIVSKYGGIQL